MKPNRVIKETPKQTKLSPESKKSLKGKDLLNSPKLVKSSSRLATKSVRTFEEMMANLAEDGDTKPVKPMLASEERVDALFNRVTTVDKTLNNLTDGLKSKISEITELKKSIKMTLGQCQNTKKTATATANIADKKKLLTTGKNATVTKFKVKDNDERKADLEEIKSRLNDVRIKSLFDEKDDMDFLKGTKNFDFAELKAEIAAFKAEKANVDKDKPFEDEKDSNNCDLDKMALNDFDDLNSAYEVGKDFSFDEEYLKEFEEFNLKNLKAGISNFERDIYKDLKMHDTKKNKNFNEMDSSEAMKKTGLKAGKEVLKNLPKTKMGAEANVDKDKTSEDSKNFDFDEMTKHFAKKNKVNKLANIKAKIDNFKSDIIKDLKMNDAKINKIFDELDLQAEIDSSETIKRTGLQAGKEAFKELTETKIRAAANVDKDKISEGSKNFELADMDIKDFADLKEHFKEFKSFDLANLNAEKANFKRDKNNFDEACSKAEIDSFVAMKKMGKADISGIKDNKNLDSIKKDIKDSGSFKDFDLTDLKIKIAKNKQDIQKKFDEIKKNKNLYEATNKDEINHFEGNGKDKSSTLKEEFAALKAKKFEDLDAIELEKYQTLAEMDVCEDKATEDIVYGDSRDFDLDEINTNDYSNLKSYYVFDEDGDDDDDDEFLGSDKKLDFSLLDDEEDDDFKMPDLNNFDKAELRSLIKRAIEAEELETKELENTKITAVEKNFELEITELKDISAAVADCKKTKNVDEAALKAELNSSKAEKVEDIGMNASKATKTQEK